MLLSETVYFRAPDGVLYRVLHYMYHAVNESAVENVANDVFSFDRERESVFLVTARAILPDGSSKFVEPTATFIQTPQSAADNSLYTSRAELNVIYPNVGPGTTTESIVVVREDVPVMPGTFVATRTFGVGWPTFLARTVVDLPAAEWKRVDAHANLPGVPDVITEEAGPGRERRIWQKRKLPRIAWEESSPDLMFTAPTLRLTSLSSWDEVAGWFNGLVSDRSSLGTELADQVDMWTKSATTQRQILEILHQKVANEVRYTGLEFGLAGYRPYACSEVWKRGYGDCKDKANLLRAMLLHKGISAHVVLLQTGSQGRVDRASPSWSQFNHAIVAVDLGGASVFCDPTVKYLPAGRLPFCDLGRDVLVVRKDKAQWVTIPDLLDARISFHADVRMSSDGELSGWFTLEATGSDAAYYADYYARRDRDDRQRSMQQTVEQYFPGAEVMDTEFESPSSSVETTRIRAYFVRPARAAKGDSLRFPYPASWLPEVSTPGDRIRPYLTNRREQTFSALITLPEGWAAAQLPAAFSAPSASAKFAASWQMKDGKLLSELHWHPEHAELAASDYAVFQRSVRALKSWLEQPVLLVRGVAVSAAPAAGAEPDLPDFPILASGAGQLRLVEQRFPTDGNSENRRRALLKVLQWFPNDAETCYTAGVHLARLEWEKIGDQAFSRKIEELLERYRAGLSSSLRGWGEYLLWTARWSASKDARAIEHLKAIALDEHMGDFRRAWSAHEAAMYWSESEPAKARDFLEPFTTVAEDVQEKNVGLYLELVLQTRDPSSIQDSANKLARALGSTADPVLAGALRELGRLWQNVPREQRLNGVSALGRVITSAAEFPSAYPLLTNLEQAVKDEQAQDSFARWLADELARRKPDWWTQTKDTRFTTSAAIIRRIEDRNEARDRNATLDGICQLWLHHTADYASAMKYLGWAFWWMDRQAQDDPLLDQLAERALKLPTASTDQVVECWSNYADHLAGRSNRSEAILWYRRILKCADARDYQRVDAGGKLAQLLLKDHQVDEALSLIKTIEPLHTKHRKSADFLYLALLVHLERGEFDRGLELVARLREQDPKFLRDATHSVAIGNLVRVGQSPARLRAYWQRASRWRPKWNALLLEAGAAVPAADDPPLETDFPALGDRIKNALNRGNRVEYLQNLDTFARLGQWIPLCTSDFARNVASAARLSPQLWRSLTECVLLMMEDLEPVDPLFDPSGRLWEAAALADLGRPSESVAKAKALYAAEHIPPGTAEAALRVWVTAARGEPDESAGLAELRRLLEGPKPLEARNEDLRTYSDALLRRDERPQNIALLVRETKRPGFSPTEPSSEWIQQRLKILQQESGNSRALTEAVQSWKAKAHLNWLDGVPPKSLSDPRFTAIKGPLEAGRGSFGLGEVLKYNLLLAEEESLIIRDREDAFAKAVGIAGYATGDAEQYADLVLSAAEYDVISASKRGLLSAETISVLLGMGQYEAAARVQKGILPGSYPQERLDSFSAAAEALRLMEIRPQDWGKKAFQVLTDKPLDYWRSNGISELLRQLTVNGDAAEADQLLAGTTGLAVDATLRSSLPALRLDWTRAVRAAKAQEPYIRRLREMLSAIPEANEPPPSVVKRHFDLEAVGGLTELQCLQLAAYRLTKYPLAPAGGWSLLRLLDRARGVMRAHPEFGPALLKLVLETPSDDKPRSLQLMASMALCDIDRATIAAGCAERLNQFVDSPGSRGFPETRRAAACALALCALRVSHEPRPPALFERLAETETPPKFRQHVQFVFWASRGHDAEALSVLDGMDEESLSSADVVRAAVDVLRRAGRNDEASLLTASGADTAHRLICDAWGKPEDSAAALRALGIICDLDRPDLIPSGWLAHVRSKLKHEIAILELEVLACRARHDWAGLRAATDAVIAREPEMYSRYLDRADALEHLGDREGAKGALRVFLQHALNEPRYPEALERFKALAPGEPVFANGRKEASVNPT